MYFSFSFLFLFLLFFDFFLFFFFLLLIEIGIEEIEGMMKQSHGVLEIVIPVLIDHYLSHFSHEESPSLKKTAGKKRRRELPSDSLLLEHWIAMMRCLTA